MVKASGGDARESILIKLHNGEYNTITGHLKWLSECMAGDQKAGQKGGKGAGWASLPVEISRIDWRDYNGRMTQGRRIGVSGIKIL